MEKAVRQSYHWNAEYNRYELAIKYENIEAILRLRRKIQAFKREVGDALFISLAILMKLHGERKT